MKTTILAASLLAATLASAALAGPHPHSAPQSEAAQPWPPGPPQEARHEPAPPEQARPAEWRGERRHDHRHGGGSWLGDLAGSLFFLGLFNR
ncbi:hypothetical protein [Rubellimicrobium aerolatum]|uniref:BA14K family protein n=1 Tax=Rubellimicrobium aerolatum TaxID=490979 RepID=A0ABW0SEV6_9RHOB|nr:hypothetical protein [Rubellimicrobium aerolatum]MBP1805663.1 hypothetical protein [Rubellimicrobium aerolatum]